MDAVPRPPAEVVARWREVTLGGVIQCSDAHVCDLRLASSGRGVSVVSVVMLRGDSVPERHNPRLFERCQSCGVGRVNKMSAYHGQSRDGYSFVAYGWDLGD